MGLRTWVGWILNNRINNKKTNTIVGTLHAILATRAICKAVQQKNPQWTLVQVCLAIAQNPTQKLHENPSIYVLDPVSPPGPPVPVYIVDWVRRGFFLPDPIHSGH